ncbi:hypothetical protein M569_03664 [Genlisea aurea]|uniref:WRKY domain-containing protein n=1 Tax=Genlisea aurea TaxID=192259 RepID=S8EEW1_9LAMI|nr:hypothetical protein M569_03664 [Genlisea aurea]
MEVDKEDPGDYSPAVDGDGRTFRESFFGFKEAGLLGELIWNHPSPRGGRFIDDFSGDFHSFVDPPTASNHSVSSDNSTTACNTAIATTDPQSIVVKKAKGKAQKRSSHQPRYSFVTESQVEQLEDGYRWRKYGQKPVKNSPFPRSYFRCTNSSCEVKKRVERSWQNPSLVITTYEGRHTHYSQPPPPT